MATAVATATKAEVNGVVRGGGGGYRTQAEKGGINVPPPPSTKITSSTASTSAQTTYSSSAYAFITHSQEGLRDNRPPIIDNAGLARRRRRRTSQHDQAILEEEYRKCDRPDKARRKEIAAMVEMGDKEVQIWFQNKRQSARRKMKPLLPHEIIPNSQTMKSSSPVQMQGYPLSLQRSLLGMGTQGGFTSVDESSSSDGSGQMPAQTEAPNAGTISNPPSSSQQSLQQRRYSHPDNARPKESNHSNDPDDNVSSNYPFSSSQASSQNHGYYSQGQTPSRKYDEAEGILPAPPSAGKLPPPIRRTSKSHIRLQEALSSDAALPAPSRSVAGTTNIPPASHGPQFLNREPPSELSEYIHSDQPPPVRGSSLVPPSSSTAAPSVPNPRRTNPTGNYQPPTLQKKTSSFLRLSTNLEGKAEVVIDTEPTLPPPLPLSGMMTPRRPAAPVASSSSVLRAVDSIKSSKVWEFYCDQKQHQHPSSSGSRSSSCSSSCSCSACAHGYRDLQHHHHHQSFEPDEAGTALSIARSRKRREELRAASRKLVFDKVENGSGVGRSVGGYGREDSGLGMETGAEVLERAPPSGKKVASKIKKSVVGASANVEMKKQRVSMGEVIEGANRLHHHPTATTTPASRLMQPSAFPASSARKRRYGEMIEIYEQPQRQPSLSRSQSQSQQTIPSSSPPEAMARIRKPGAKAGGAIAGGEDYYIQGGESDKENYLHGREGNEEEVAVQQQKMVSKHERVGERERKGYSSQAMTGIKAGRRTMGEEGSKIVSLTSSGTEKRAKKKRRTVLGEVADGGNENGVGSGVSRTGEQRGGAVVKQTVSAVPATQISQAVGVGSASRVSEDLDLGGAELLLSLSAGKWR